MFGVLNTGIFILAGISGLCKISAQFNVTCFFIYLTKQKTPFLKTMCKFILFLKDIQKKISKFRLRPKNTIKTYFVATLSGTIISLIEKCFFQLY